MCSAIGRHRCRKQHVHGVIEPDHVEAVARLQPAKRVSKARLGLHDRGAAHRAGIVDHEDYFTRQRLLLGLANRGRGDERQQIVGVADMLAEQPDRRRRFGRGFPGQLEIAIGRHRAFREPDDARGVVRAFDFDLMMVALDFAERETGLQAHGDLGRIDRRVVRGVEHRRRDAVAVRHRIGRGRAPSAAVAAKVDALHDRRGIIARADHHRHAEGKRIAGLMHRLLIFDLHQHGFAGTDIGDRVGEDIRPLLLGQRRLLPVLPRLLVDHARLLPLLDLADDDAVADHHFQRVDRAAFRQRIDVSSLHPVLRRVFEDLRDAGANRRARDRQIDVDAEPCGFAGCRRHRFSEAASRSAPRRGRRDVGPSADHTGSKLKNNAANPTRIAAMPCMTTNNSSFTSRGRGDLPAFSISSHMVILLNSEKAVALPATLRSGVALREHHDRHCSAAGRSSAPRGVRFCAGL